MSKSNKDQKNGKKGNDKREFDDATLTKSFAPKPKSPKIIHDLGSKYDFYGDAEIVKVNGKEYVVRRIIALRTFNTTYGTVREGTVGGYVETFYNLSHKGKCWVADNAMAIGEARVRDDAQLRGNAIAMDRVVVCAEGQMFGITRACGGSRISGRAKMLKGKLVRGYVLTGCDVMDVDEVRVGNEAVAEKPEAVQQPVAYDEREVQTHRVELRALSAILWGCGFTRLYRTVSLPACIEVTITMNGTYCATLRLRYGEKGYEYILFNANRRVSDAKDCSPQDFAELIMKLDVSKFVRAAA